MTLSEGVVEQILKIGIIGHDKNNNYVLFVRFEVHVLFVSSNLNIPSFLGVGVGWGFCT